MSLQRRAFDPRARRDHRPRIDTSVLALPKPGDKAKHMAFQSQEFAKHREPSAQVRRDVFARDTGVCANCNLDTESMLSAWYAAEENDKGQYVCNICDRLTPSIPCIYCNAVTCSQSFDQRNAFRGWLEEIGFPKDFARKYRGETLWHADHRVPVEEGGVDLGPDNFQTLCVRCHVERSSYQAQTRAMRRRHAR